MKETAHKKQQTRLTSSGDCRAHSLTQRKQNQYCIYWPIVDRLVCDGILCFARQWFEWISVRWSILFFFSSFRFFNTFSIYFYCFVCTTNVQYTLHTGEWRIKQTWSNLSSDILTSADPVYGARIWLIHVVPIFDWSSRKVIQIRQCGREQSDQNSDTIRIISLNPCVQSMCVARWNIFIFFFLHLN